MAVETSYTDARARLAELLDRATEDRETIIITRRGSPDVALIAADELVSLQETAHLLRSPANARRLLAALQRSLAGDVEPRTVAELRAELGLDTTPG
jgi:antitoxin YefM